MNEVVLKWIERAKEDLQLVENELKVEEPLYNTISFHIQQFVEKYLKAFLISKNVLPERTHSIDLLLYKCKAIDNDFEVFFESSIVDLTECAVSVRYPENDIYIDEDFVDEMLELTYKLKELIDTKLGLDSLPNIEKEADEEKPE
jgi:HEPN domain-containing protein